MVKRRLGQIGAAVDAIDDLETITVDRFAAGLFCQPIKAAASSAKPMRRLAGNSSVVSASVFNHSRHEHHSQDRQCSLDEIRPTGINRVGFPSSSAHVYETGQHPQHPGN
ncbi:MAG: hypothetical protein H0U43_07430 [Chthoniobacterales bacterium]|nr:hypothetical protein [Chthoniobacterales bacterium]